MLVKMKKKNFCCIVKVKLGSVALAMGYKIHLCDNFLGDSFYLHDSIVFRDIFRSYMVLIEEFISLCYIIDT